MDTMIEAGAGPVPAGAPGPFTLAIDIGGSGLKASVLDAAGRMVIKRVRVPTPQPSRPDSVVEAIETLVAALPAYDRISAGFPGVVRDGRVITAPNLGTPEWRAFPLEAVLARRLGRPARVLNDAEVQGLGIVTGRGLEVVLTLGTGIGSAVFRDGRPTPHLELAQHPIRKDKTYDLYLGNAARLAITPEKWNRRVRRTIGIVRTLLNFDVLYLGGGNAECVKIDLPPDVKLADNSAGITGGVRLWEDGIWQAQTQT